MTYTERSEEFDNELDEMTPEITVCGITMTASNVLYNTDPIAYRCAVADWEDYRENA